MLRHPNGPVLSLALIVTSKSPEAKKVATDVEASGNSTSMLSTKISPALNLNGHVQSMPYWANDGGHACGLKEVGTKVAIILHKSSYVHEPT